MKKSPWHDISVDPVHVGVYELKQSRNRERLIWSWWDGECFSGAWYSIEVAIESKDWANDYYRVFPFLFKCRLEGCSQRATAWRGILKD